MELRDVRIMAYELFEQHGLGKSDWAIKFNRSTTAAGECNFNNGAMTLSAKFMEKYDEDDVREVILHEIGHIMAGPGKGHGNAWKAEVKKLGGKPKQFAPKSDLKEPEYTAALGLIVTVGAVSYQINTVLFVVIAVIAAISVFGLIFERFAPVEKSYNFN